MGSMSAKRRRPKIFFETLLSYNDNDLDIHTSVCIKQIRLKTF